MNTRHLLVASVIAASAMAAAASAAWAVKSPAVLAGFSAPVRISMATVHDANVASTITIGPRVAAHR